MLVPKPIFWKLHSFLTQTLNFVPINLHRYWTYTRVKSEIGNYYSMMESQDRVQLQKALVLIYHVRPHVAEYTKHR